jgi:hypothetical protein
MDDTIPAGLKARFVISASRSTTRLRSQKKSTSELPGQSRHALPTHKNGEIVPTRETIAT